MKQIWINALALLAGVSTAWLLWGMGGTILPVLPGTIVYSDLPTGGVIVTTKTVAYGSWALVCTGLGVLLAWSLANRLSWRGLWLLVILPLWCWVVAAYLLLLWTAHGAPLNYSDSPAESYLAGLLPAYLAFRCGAGRVRHWSVRPGMPCGANIYPTWLTAPPRPEGLTGFLNTLTSHTPLQSGVALIESFENAIAAKATEEIVSSPLVYLSGWRVVPMAARTLLSNESTVDLRSQAYRVRQGLDEFWFVLHCHPAPTGCTYQLEAKARSLNYLPLLLLGGFVLLCGLSLTGLFGRASSQVITGLGVVGFFLHVTGLHEILANKERGQQRRAARLSRLLPLFNQALAEALFQLPVQSTMPSAPSAAFPVAPVPGPPNTAAPVAPSSPHGTPAPGTPIQGIPTPNLTTSGTGFIRKRRI